MTEDQKLRLITGGEKLLGESDPNTVLGLALVKSFMLCNREDKLKIIQFANQLASSGRLDDD
jgi:hypothetical protein